MNKAKPCGCKRERERERERERVYSLVNKLEQKEEVESN